MSPDPNIKQRNKNNTAAVTSISVGETAVCLCAKLESRISFVVCVDPDATDGIWIRCYPTSTDNEKTGIYRAPGQLWEMTPGNIYNGELSAVSRSGNQNVHVTEY